MLTTEIAYLACPYARETLRAFGLVRANSEVTTMVDTMGSNTVSYKMVKEKSRVARNLILYAELCNKYPNSTMLKELSFVSEETGHKRTPKKFYYAIAKIEYIYSKMLAGDKNMLNALALGEDCPVGPTTLECTESTQDT